ncbi:MAG TPA: lysylphosphatidylglycerol synthase transmembrane domain-containing protein [Bryobacteraceae bacterium]
MLAGVLLYFSMRGVDWRHVWQTIRTAEWLFIAGAVGLTMLSFFLRAMRWRILLNAETRFSVGTVFWANSAGYLGNNFLPARAGELIRSFLISSRSSLSRTYVLTTALGERLMDVIALVLASSLVLMGLEAKPRWMSDLSRTMAFIATAGAIAVTVMPHTGRLVENVLQRLPLPERFRTGLLRLAEQILLGLRAFHDWRRFAGFVFLTVVIWTSDCVGAITVAHALGIAMSFQVALLLLTAIGLSSGLPSTPGYVGIFQFVAVTVLTPFGIAKDSALAYILVVQAIGYLVVVAFGLPALFRLQATRRAVA